MNASAISRIGSLTLALVALPLATALHGAEASPHEPYRRHSCRRLAGWKAGGTPFLASMRALSLGVSASQGPASPVGRGSAEPDSPREMLGSTESRPARPMLTGLGPPAKGASLERGWARPPVSTKPWCYWYWITDNVSREGITRDLEAMARVGIGEAFIGNIHLEDVKPGRVQALTEEWWGMVEHAIREGGRVGVDIGFFNCPGWSQSGGPWVRPDQAMRFLVSSEQHVTGPAWFEGRIPPPREPFQDVSLVAFPAPRLDGDAVRDHAPRIHTVPSAEDAERMFDGDPDTVLRLPAGAARGTTPFIIEMSFARPFTARSLVLHPAGNAFALECELEVEVGEGRFRRLRSFACDRSNLEVNVGPMPFGPVAVSFPATAGRKFRLVLTHLTGQGGFSEIELSGAARLERYIEKQLGKMHPTPQPRWDTYLWPAANEPESPAFAVSPDRVVDLSGRLDPDGTLRWEVPAGEWIILRTGMTPTGTKNAPASPEGQGLEVDKMNRAAAAAHFDAYVGQLLARLPPAARTAFKHVVADSYEMGSQNWTDGFGALFRRRYRYDPRPWFPVLTGRVVGSADESDRFLWDLRRLVADRVALDYVGGLRDVCHRNGLGLWLENYGHWGFPAEFLGYGGQADRVGGEFWATGELGAIELRAAASAAHIYGMPVVSAEAFTGGPLFTSTPWSLKRRGDWAATEGINHFVLHVYIHQPDERRPGINAWFGTEFNRHNTWFESSRVWVDYLRRTHFLLQQGRHVADVAYFIGEDTPKMTGPRTPALPEGYDFDDVNAEVIERRLAVEDRRWVLPDGTSYCLLVLPALDTMRPELLRKIGELVAAGGAILGAPPRRSPSLENYPACDQQVRELASRIWRKCDGQRVTETRYQKGRVLRGLDLAAALERLDVPPDVGGLEASPVRWTHRTAEETEIYFLSNQSERSVRVAPTFRVEGRAPELWHPDSARIERPAVFAFDGDRTRVTLELEPRGSVFVVFRARKDRAPTLLEATRGNEILWTTTAAANQLGDSDVGTGASDQESRVAGGWTWEEEFALPPLRLERGVQGAVRATICDNGTYRLAFSDRSIRALEIRELAPPRELGGPWEVRFPAGMDMPEQVRFERLISWPEHTDARIRYFAGTATYRCDFPQPADLGTHLVLDLGRVESLAAVRLNGQNLGLLWKPPFRLDVSGVAWRELNTLEVDVTNVWLNRLLGAKRHPQGLPGADNPAFQPYLAADLSRPLGESLLPGGLLGPVRLVPYRRVNIE